MYVSQLNVTKAIFHCLIQSYAACAVVKSLPLARKNVFVLASNAIWFNLFVITAFCTGLVEVVDNELSTAILLPHQELSNSLRSYQS